MSYNTPQPASNGSNGYRTNRTIMRPAHFPLNHSVDILLGPGEPTREDGQYGPQFRYFLDRPTDALLYASEALHIAIQEARAQHGTDKLTVLKTKQGRSDVWTIGPIPTELVAPIPHRPQEAAARPVPIDHTPAALAARQNREAQMAAAMAQYPEAAEKQDAQPAAQTRAASQRTASEVQMLRCWITAIDLISHCRQYAQDKHKLLIEPRCEDVRALAATLYIGGGK